MTLIDDWHEAYLKRYVVLLVHVLMCNCGAWGEVGV